jgi:hypothetical protein
MRHRLFLELTFVDSSVYRTVGMTLEGRSGLQRYTSQSKVLDWSGVTMLLPANISSSEK